jgi:hypothetical protein
LIDFEKWSVPSGLVTNLDRLQGSRVEGVDPAFDTITEGSYPVSRSVYFCVKGGENPIRKPFASRNSPAFNPNQSKP